MKITDKTLSAWMDDSLSPKQMKIVSAAVQSDPELQARSEALRAVGAMLRQESFEVPVPAERMAADVRRVIRQTGSSQPRRLPLWIPVGATACACLLLAAVWMLSITGTSATAFQAKIESVDSELSGAATMVYTDRDAGWTVVWLDGVELEPGT